MKNLTIYGSLTKLVMISLFFSASHALASECKFETSALAGDGSGKGDFFDNQITTTDADSLSDCISKAQMQIRQTRDFHISYRHQTSINRADEIRVISQVDVVYSDNTIEKVRLRLRARGVKPGLIERAVEALPQQGS